jgi:hypothetical protein
MLSIGMLALGTAGADTGVSSNTGPTIPDRFSATTAQITPRDVGLRVDVRTWSDEAGRADVVAALGGAEPSKALAELPILGYVWRSGSGVGYGVRYAHRTPTADGERLTFVTDKRLGSYEFKPWVLDAPRKATDLEYSVIELYLDRNGAGTGSLSLAAPVEIDTAAATIKLADDAPRVLADAKAQPKALYPAAH